MVKVKLFMKSGNIIKFKCESIKFTYDGNNIVTGYEITKPNNLRTWINTDQIEGIFMNK